MTNIPVIGFSAWSGVGKTSLIEKLIPALSAAGLRVAVIKHDVHGLDLDPVGTDSQRFVAAGAAAVLAAGGAVTLLREQRPRPLEALLELIRDADLILVEGYKDQPMAQIGLYRPSSGKGLPAAPDRYAAIVTDARTDFSPVPVFSFEDIPGLARFVAEHRYEFHFPQAEADRKP